MRRFVASAFGLGLIPRRLWGSDAGAGTFGAALAALIGWGLIDASWVVDLTVATVAIAVALWASHPFADGDPGWVAIDEVAGTLVALIGLNGLPWLIALAVARVTDITKLAPGMRWAESLAGTAGITADDVLAGLYGLAVGGLVMAL